jgi:hypothetical protein
MENTDDQHSALSFELQKEGLPKYREQDRFDSS